PDLLVLSEQGAEMIAGEKRSLVRRSMPTPLVVVEVVSPGEPGEPNYDRDYIEKRLEYGALGIGEYWIVDPQRQVVWVLVWVDGVYRERRFEGKEQIESACFPGLGLTVQQVLAPGG
ncbi:MAG: Uma2 family endonuclease, partial [Synechococcales cyanobacterium RM1_1_8]|nr:Uma2 family endonuclease [Synechococcales cyanobacterium RM1_1_8]